MSNEFRFVLSEPTARVVRKITAELGAANLAQTIAIALILLEDTLHRVPPYESRNLNASKTGAQR